MSFGQYRLDVRSPGDLIISTLEGFFSLPQVAAYTREVEALIGRCSLSHGGYRIVIDISTCAIQSQEVTAAFARHVSSVPRSRRVAVVTRSSIIRMQIRRVIGRPELAVFEHLPEALLWIDATQKEQAA
jgi:hypothetical protein